MGYKQIRTSDLSGADLADDQVVTVLVKQHPDIQDAKVFDASVEELAGLKGITDLVELELRGPSGEIATVFLRKADFQKFVTNEQLEKFDSARGRRTGYRPGNT